MTWLVRKHVGRKARAHIWLGDDTQCRMWSTGCMIKSSYEVVEDRGHRLICTMCEAVSKKTGAAHPADRRMATP